VRIEENDGKALASLAEKSPCLSFWHPAPHRTSKNIVRKSLSNLIANDKLAAPGWHILCESAGAAPAGLPVMRG
jgi:hypothetical protein